MANFNTHVSIASTASAMVAAMSVNSGLIELIDVPWFIFTGVIGGMLPDIDADNSIPVKRLFLFLAGLCSVGIWAIFETLMTAQRLTVMVVVTFFVIRYPVFLLFQKTTVHRGVLHSLLGALFFGLLTICISFYCLKLDVLRSWLFGVFLVFGFLVHLFLDEIFSVDLANGRMKKSFGTALKLFSYKDITSSSLLFISVLALYVFAPSPAHLVQVWKRAEWVNVDFMGLAEDVGDIKRASVQLTNQLKKSIHD